MEMLILVPKITNRLYYIFELMLKDELGIDFKFTTDKDSYLSHEGAKLHYGKYPMPEESGLYQQAANILFEHDIADQDVKYYFSVADALVLPYKSATQSGVTQIAYNVCTPMIVTEVGGLPEIVPNDVVGYACQPTVEGVAEAIEKLYADDNLARFRENIVEERKRFSWAAMCDKLLEVYQMCK